MANDTSTQTVQMNLKLQKAILENIRRQFLIKISELKKMAKSKQKK